MPPPPDGTGSSNNNPSALNWVGAGLAALGGGAGNVSGQSGTTDSNSNSNTDTTFNTGQTGTSRPLYDDKTLEYRNGLLDYLHQYLVTDPDLSGYKSNGLAQINRDSDAGQMGLGQALAARGLNTSPVAANALGQANNARIASSSQFSNSIPMLAEQLRQQRLQQVTGFFSGLPVGTSSQNDASGHSYTTAGQQSHTETKVKKSPWDIIGGIAGGLGGALAVL